MADRSSWAELRERRLREPGAGAAYAAARLAFELGGTVRTLRQQRGLTQSQVARAAGMTQAIVARFEAGGAIPTVPVLDRLAEALGADLVIHLNARPEAGDD